MPRRPWWIWDKRIYDVDVQQGPVVAARPSAAHDAAHRNTGTLERSLDPERAVPSRMATKHNYLWWHHTCATCPSLDSVDLSLAETKFVASWLTLADAWVYLGCSRQTIYRELARGALIADGRVGHRMRFSSEALDRYVTCGLGLAAATALCPSGRDA